MSTWIGYQCHDHNPPIESYFEVGRHMRDVPDAQYALKNRSEILEQGADWAGFPETMRYCWRITAASFFREHPNCNIKIFTEYGKDVTNYKEEP